MSATTLEPAIQAVGLTRSYGDGRGIFDIDLEVNRGEVVALLGPNGAGKTTLVEILEGLRYYEQGSVRVLGDDPVAAAPLWRSRIGAVLQLGTETDEYTVGEMLRAHARYYPRPRPIAEVVDLLELTALTDQRISTLSGGQRRRVDVALGIIGDPDMLFLDEPTTGLDPGVRRMIWDLVSHLADTGTTVLLTTHYLDEVDHLAQRTIVLVDGGKVWEGPTGDLTGQSSASTVSFRLRPPTTAAELPPGLPAAQIDQDGRISIGTPDSTGVVAALMEWGHQHPNGSPVEELDINRPSLEEAYLTLLEEGGADQ